MKTPHVVTVPEGQSWEQALVGALASLGYGPDAVVSGVRAETHPSGVTVVAFVVEEVEDKVWPPRLEQKPLPH